MVKIRLTRIGRHKDPFFRIVAADQHYARDGRIIEQIGTYNPMTEPSTVVLNKEKLAQWIKNGAKPTETVKALIETGILVVLALAGILMMDRPLLLAKSPLTKQDAFIPLRA